MLELVVHPFRASVYLIQVSTLTAAVVEIYLWLTAKKRTGRGLPWKLRAAGPR
jgi:hypothetical protein